MEMNIVTISEILGLMLGGCGIGSLFTIRYVRMKARGEARSVENEATKAVQDVYQEMVEDVKKDREEQKSYILELKEDRNHLRHDRDELRKENENLRKTTISLQEDIQDVKREQARQGRKLEVITPFICSRTECTERIRASIKDLTKRKENKNIKTEE